MPPPPRSLPSSFRDGRLGSSSLLSGGPSEHYYTNEEIEFIHEIVLAAEEELPRLPERDRLPTNALFRAVEKIYAQDGRDPQNVEPPISRLIFKIGGQRGSGSLMDKFRAVLGKMGIELEFHEDAGRAGGDEDGDGDGDGDAYGGERDDRNDVVGSDIGGSADQTGTFPIAPGVQGRKRRNSDLSVPSDDGRDGDRHQPVHSRSVSSSALDDTRDDVLPTVEADGENEKWSAFDPMATPGHRRQFVLPQSTQDSASMEEASMPKLPMYSGRDAFGIGAHKALPLRPLRQRSEIPDSYVVDRSPSTLPDTIADTENARASQQSFNESESAFRGASDTTVQSQDVDFEVPYRRLTLEQLEKRLRDYQERLIPVSYLRLWWDTAYSAREDRTLAESQADRFDLECVIPEVLEIWDSNSYWQINERFEAEAEAGNQREIARQERKATRAYELRLCHKALTHWMVCAEEEAQRTALARRHMLRKKLFTAWREHHARQEAKVAAFLVNSSLRCWSEAVEVEDDGEALAVQKYEGDLVEYAFRRWLEAYHVRLSEAMADRSAVEKSLAQWTESTAVLGSLHLELVNKFQSGQLSKTLIDWSSLADASNAQHEAGLSDVCLSEAKSITSDWQAYAVLQSRLKDFTAAQETELKIGALEIWSAEAVTATSLSEQAPRLFVDDYLDTWIYETKLIQIQQKFGDELANETLYDWYLTEKLTFFERYSVDKSAQYALQDWLDICLQAHGTSESAWHRAETMDLESTIPTILSDWCLQTEHQSWHEENADTVITHHAVGDTLEIWSDRLAEMEDWPDWADRGAYFCAVTDAFSWWPQAAKKSREDRITRVYHDFRQRFKTGLVTDALLSWRAAAEDSEVAGWEAEQIRMSRDEEAAIDTFEFWDAYAQNQETCNEIAIEADIEAQYTQWASAAETEAELGMDAIDYSSGQILNNCCENWELAALQLAGRQYTVAEVQEKNDKKLSRQVLSAWAQITFPEMIQDESTLGQAFRRSGRSSSATSGLFSTPAPQSSMTSYGSEVRAAARSAGPAQQLSRISEEEAPKRSTLIGLTSPYQDLRESPERQSRRSPHELERVPGSRSPLFRGATTAGSLPLQNFGTSIQRGYERPTTYETPYATAASRFSRSDQQLPPMSDFDEDFRTDDGTTGPMLISTPTRWTGIARPFGQSQRPTTTPMAPVPTPYQRVMSEGYGGISTAARQSVASRRQTPRVAFASKEDEGGDGL